MSNRLIIGIILCLCISVSFGIAPSTQSAHPKIKTHCLLKLGDPVPAFLLYDQHGNSVTHQSILGKTVVLNFIFTGCMEPTKCPTATQKMRELQTLVKNEALHNEVQFISITFDPKNDTSEVLKRYAEGFNVDAFNYSFLTGDIETVKRLVKAFGVFAITEKGTINHTMKTVIFNEEGVMIYENSKTDWDPKVLLSIIKKTQKA